MRVTGMVRRGPRTARMTIGVLLCAAFWSVMPAAAENPSARLAALFDRAGYPADWFAPDFTDKAPPEKLAGIIAGLQKEYGAFRAVERRRNDYLVRLAKAAVPAEIAFDADGRISSLLFKKAEPEFDDGAAVRAAFEALPGDVALLVEEGGEERLSINADKTVSVASAFKMTVLSEVARAVDAGRLRWDQAVPLREEWRSLPSGQLQNWPVGQRLTLESLAALMISISDNTAADALLGLAGRAALEKAAPANTPFLDTRSLFVLKASGNSALRQRYLAGDAAARRAVLAEVAQRPLPETAEVAGSATPGLGWFYSSRELCATARTVADLPAMRINPGLATPAAWKSIAFKGGGDQGVLNLTTVVEDTSGRRLCVTATWNDSTDLDKGRFFAIYAGLLRFLRTPA